MYRSVLFLPAILLLAFSTSGQQQKPDSAAAQKTASYSAIPVEAAKAPNPVKPTPESQARAKKWWTLDCEMCHNKNGDGKGETAKDMKLTMVDLTDPVTLKDHTDGEIYWIIKNGHNDMPAEGTRITADQDWDLVNYVRALAKKKEVDTKQESEAKSQTEAKPQ
jgi:mono/diheme cytochrome c family protein